MPTTRAYLEGLRAQMQKRLPSGVIADLHARAMRSAGGRLRRKPDQPASPLERTGVTSLTMEHLRTLTPLQLADIHGRLHQMSGHLQDEDAQHTLELAHARVSSVLGENHPLVHNLDFAGRSPHDLDDLAKESYTSRMSDAELNAVHDHLHQAFTIWKRALPHQAPVLHAKNALHGLWLTHGYAKGVVSGAMSTPGWRVVTAPDPRDVTGVRRTIGLIQLNDARKVGPVQFAALADKHRMGKTIQKASSTGGRSMFYQDVIAHYPLVEPRPYLKVSGMCSLADAAGPPRWKEPFDRKPGHGQRLLAAHKQVSQEMAARGHVWDDEKDDMLELAGLTKAGPGDTVSMKPYSPVPMANVDVEGQPVGAAFVNPGLRGSTSETGGGKAPQVEHDLPSETEIGAPPYAKALDETPGQFRWRIHDPEGYRSIRTIDLSGKAHGIQALVGRPKGGSGKTEITSLHFPKEHWTRERVHSWLSEHGEGFKKWLAKIGPGIAAVHVTGPIGAFRYVPQPDERLISKMVGDRREVEFLAKTAKKQIVYGVVMEPHEVDTQGDYTTPEVIEETAHRWLGIYRIAGEQHHKVARPYEVYESYIAPVDFTLGKQRILKGSWVLALHILDQGLWKDIENGVYTGYSIGGFGKSEPSSKDELVSLRRAERVEKATAAKIVMARHGSTTYNRGGTGLDLIRGQLDVPLDEQGQHQAVELAKRLASEFKITKIYTSDLKRTADTARTIAAKQSSSNIRVVPTAALESWGLGDLEGKPTNHANVVKIRDWVMHPDKVPPGHGGESFNHYTDRIVKFYEALLQPAKPGDVSVVVSHARGIQLFESWVDAGQSKAKMIEEFSKELASEPDTVRPGGYVVLTQQPDKTWKLTERFRPAQTRTVS